ncbi:hypothetical protein CBI38_24655 [Rhodococcus oxybenzonivorans]|uniref:DUF3987 domain-containing protein n=1 Tax=Rhodococcus oxybenzonivorans TaxID=1990687 RepID=A0A2S2C086_9NOCA|nr:hypothetical protein [Rhodococcus oxybenzonivorans]AWK74269.1 hypothetical protein CBI38_24655 [Rhodococcus oxybenzonivorans]
MTAGVFDIGEFRHADTEPDGEFWDAKPALAHVRDFARSRMASPWATLGVTLARVIATIEPSVVLPPIVGGEAPLNFYMATVSRSGGGKGAAMKASQAAFPFVDEKGAQLFDQRPPGSGEGFVKSFARYRSGEKGEEGRIEHTRTRVCFDCSEISILTALTGRQNATLGGILLQAAMGEVAGFSNSDETRSVWLQPHTYRATLVVGAQELMCGPLFDQAGSGLPQRFLYMPGADEAMPDITPSDPGPYEWTVPPDIESTFDALNRADGSTPTFAPTNAVTVCKRAEDLIRQHRRDQNRGIGDPLDGHALLLREKVAFGLAVLCGESDMAITDEYWDLAGEVMSVSNRTRDGIQEALKGARAQSEKARAVAKVDADLHAEDHKEKKNVQRVGVKVRGMLSDGDWHQRKPLRAVFASRDRDAFDILLARMESSGEIETREVGSGNKAATEYRLLTAAR